MGQQQLLLVILVTIIVGIATVVAINTFGSAADSANLDAVRQDVAQIAAGAQGFYMRPSMLGGGDRTFDNISFNDISFPAEEINGTGDTAFNQNGTYVLDGSGENLTITAYPSSEMDGAPSLTTITGPSMVAVAVRDGMTWTNSNPTGGTE